MDVKKQKLLIEAFLSSPTIFSIALPIVKANYFHDDLKVAVQFILDYHNKYNSLPDSDQIYAESNTNIKLRDIPVDKEQYHLNELEKFCKEMAIHEAVWSAAQILTSSDKSGDSVDYGKIEKMVRDAVLVSLNKDLGTNYFENPLDRINNYIKNTSTISTGWKTVDAFLDGGISRKEMLIFTANSGGGKSIVMNNLGINLAEQGLNVLVISLELSEDMIARRMDTMISGLDKSKIISNKEVVASKIEKLGKKMGEFYIKRMKQGSNVNDFRAYIKEFTLKNNYTPDVLIVDYIDLMGSIEKISRSEIFTKDKMVSEELYELGHEFDMYLVTASQQNRSAVGVKDTDQSHIAGGISKINTTDICISLIDYKDQGEIGFKFLKTRSSNGVGKVVGLRWDSVKLRVFDIEEGGFSLATTRTDKPINKAVPKILDTKDIKDLTVFDDITNNPDFKF